MLEPMPEAQAAADQRGPELGVQALSRRAVAVSGLWSGNILPIFAYGGVAG